MLKPNLALKQVHNNWLISLQVIIPCLQEKKIKEHDSLYMNNKTELKTQTVICWVEKDVNRELKDLSLRTT